VISRALVTGGAGFIGSHLVERLLACGDQVTVLDDFSSGTRDNLADASRLGELQIVEGSVLDGPAVATAMRGCRQVFHLAVQCVRRSLGQPIENHTVNATGTLLVLDEARRQRIDRFVYCSSSEVYGNCGDQWLNEVTSQCKPVTVYGAAKLAGEYYTSAYHQTYGLSTVIVRPFNSYGPREHDRGDLAEVIPRFVARVLNGQPPVIFGNGTNGRDFTYVTETASGIALTAQADTLIGRTVNLAYGRMLTIRDVAQSVARACGRPDLEPIFIEPRPGDVMALQADTALARQFLGFAATIDFEAGLRRYIDWLRQRHPDPAALLEAEVRNWRLPDDGEASMAAQSSPGEAA
jgi:UDP-glucose 4-epimerase